MAGIVMNPQFVPHAPHVMLSAEIRAELARLRGLPVPTENAKYVLRWRAEQIVQLEKELARRVVLRAKREGK